MTRGEGGRIDGGVALEAGAGLLAGFALLAAVSALAIALLLPLPSEGIGLRLEHHLFDAAETLGVGALASAVGAAAALVTRPRWVTPVLYAIAGAPIVYLAVGEDLHRAAGFVRDSRFEGAAFVAYFAGQVGAFAGIHVVGTQGSQTPRLRAAAVALAVGGMVVDHLVFADDYTGVHGMVALSCALFAGVALAPVAGPAARRLARTRRGRAVFGAVGALALFGLACPPPNAVRCELFRRTCAFAPWALATALWKSPALHAPVSLEPSAWLRDRSADPPVPPSEPRLLPEDAVVVLLTIDAVRADALADPANDSLLPNLAAMRRSGVSFRRATAPGAQTAVSLSSVFSGRYFSELYWTRHGQGETRFTYPAEDASPRFPELLSEHGVATASYDALIFLANEFGVARGFREEHVVVEGARHGEAREVVGPLLEQLQLRGGRGPLFLFTHLTEPHAPYDRGALKEGPARDRWLSEVAVADEQVGRVLRVLQRVAGDRWVLVVSSDHGEAFGDHQTWEHGKTLYDELLHVPLLVAGPRIAPRTVEQRVGLIDLGPTILDLFGVPTPATYEGQSLAPLLAGRDAVLTRPLVSEGRLRRALTLPDGLKVIDDPRRKDVEVYDLSADPGETRNLFDVDPGRADPALAFLRAFFDAHTMRRGDYRPPFKL